MGQSPMSNQTCGVPENTKKKNHFTYFPSLLEKKIVKLKGDLRISLQYQYQNYSFTDLRFSNLKPFLSIVLTFVTK